MLFFGEVLIVSIFLLPFVTSEKGISMKESKQRQIITQERSILFCSHGAICRTILHLYNPFEVDVDIVTLYHGLQSITWPFFYCVGINPLY